jgi:hypothetical protein
VCQNIYTLAHLQIYIYIYIYIPGETERMNKDVNINFEILTEVTLHVVVDWISLTMEAAC